MCGVCPLPLCPCCLQENCCGWSYGQIECGCWSQNQPVAVLELAAEPLDPPFLYQQGPEYPLWTILPGLELLHVSKLPHQNSIINKIKYNCAEVNHISSNIRCFSLHFPGVFFPSSGHGEITSMLLTDVIVQSLLGAWSVSSVKCALIPVRCHFRLYRERGVDGMCGKHFNLVNSLIWCAT